MPNKLPNYRWIGFFVVLAILAGVALALPILYNLGQQLRREQLQLARERWREHGPRDYDLTFSIRLDRDTTKQRHVVCVRDGRVVVSLVEGQPLHVAPAYQGAIGLPFATSTDHPPWTIEQIFDHLQSLLTQQEQSHGRHFLVAVFDPEQGWPRRVVWRITRSSQREEWDLKLWRLGELEAEARRYR
ncbi:MAG: DUF6174 domain-containing protein [Gemmataceae bacterium]